jgi:hypothetical protein
LDVDDIYSDKEARRRRALEMVRTSPHPNFYSHSNNPNQINCALNFPSSSLKPLTFSTFTACTL